MSVMLFLYGVVCSLRADMFYGEPDPSHPTFGRLIDFDDKEEGPVEYDDYADPGGASITETEGLAASEDFGYYEKGKFS